MIFMCSGQGSQYYQMGRELFLRYPDFRRCMQEMDRVVLELSGTSVLGALYDPSRRKSDLFDSICITSPAIFMLEFALASLLIEGGTVPDRILGSSMGVYAAAAIAGCMDRDEALRIIVTQARIFERQCPPGGMISVLGDPALVAGAVRSGHCEIAAVNLPNHFTLAAPEAQLAGIESLIADERVSFQRIAVRHAFHSRWIDAANQPLEAFLRTLKLRSPHIPIVCCAGARTLRELPQTYFWSVAREPIRFYDTMQQLEREGPFRYVDVGPAGSLATLVKYALGPGSKSSVHAALSPYSSDWQTFQSLQGSLRV